jgi:hypothetical protein
MFKIAYVSLLLAIGASVIVGWALSVTGKSLDVPNWRRRLLFLGLIGNAASLIVLVTAIMQVTHLPTVTADVANYRIFFPLAVVPIALGAFGRRAPRVLVILNGLVLTFLWLDLAASSR